MPQIYAAGDIANFHSVALGKRVPVEHEDNANTMGRIAGQNMAGGDFVYEAPGEVAADVGVPRPGPCERHRVAAADGSVAT